MELIGVADEYAAVVFESRFLERPGRSARAGRRFSAASSPNLPAPRTSRVLARAPCHQPRLMARSTRQYTRSTRGWQIWRRRGRKPATSTSRATWALQKTRFENHSGIFIGDSD